MIDTTQPNEPETVTEAFRCGPYKPLVDEHVVREQAEFKQNFDSMIEAADKQLQQYQVDYAR